MIIFLLLAILAFGSTTAVRPKRAMHAMPYMPVSDGEQAVYNRMVEYMALLDPVNDAVIIAAAKQTPLWISLHAKFGNTNK